MLNAPYISRFCDLRDSWPIPARDEVCLRKEGTLTLLLHDVGCGAVDKDIRKGLRVLRWWRCPLTLCVVQRPGFLWWIGGRLALRFGVAGLWRTERVMHLLAGLRW